MNSIILPLEISNRIVWYVRYVNLINSKFAELFSTCKRVVLPAPLTP